MLLLWNKTYWNFWFEDWLECVGTSSLTSFGVFCSPSMLCWKIALDTYCVLFDWTFDKNNHFYMHTFFVSKYVNYSIVLWRLFIWVMLSPCYGISIVLRSLFTWRLMSHYCRKLSVLGNLSTILFTAYQNGAATYISFTYSGEWFLLWDYPVQQKVRTFFTTVSDFCICTYASFIVPTSSRRQRYF